MLTILIIFASFGLVKIIINIVQQHKHLDDETIQDYLHGRIKKNTDESRKVTVHLGLCEKCRNKMTKQDLD